MKTRQHLLNLALFFAIPTALHAQHEADDLGHPAKDTAQTEATEADEATDQPTGARERSDIGAPGNKNIRSTKRDTVDAAGTIADALRDAENLTMLHDLVEAAGIEQVLEGEGPYTVFAPSNEALSEIPEETREIWLKPENKEALRKILLGHVVGGSFPSASLGNEEEVVTAGRTTVVVTRTDEAVMVGEATVTQPDIRVGNGVIHIVDSVLMPERDMPDAE